MFVQVYRMQCGNLIRKRYLSYVYLFFRLARKERDQEMSTDRNVMKNIIDTWKEIKNLRQFQGYTNTTVKLKIQK